MKNAVLFTEKNLSILFSNISSFFSASLMSRLGLRTLRSQIFFALFFFFGLTEGAFATLYTYNASTYTAARSGCQQELNSAIAQNSYPNRTTNNEIINSCPLLTGYYVGYHNWFSVKYRVVKIATGATVEEIERWYFFDGDLKKNAGNGGGCDGGEGGNNDCARAQGSPITQYPINVATGNKYFEELDYSDNQWLMFRRFYNSSDFVDRANLGERWRHSFDRSFFSFNLSNPALIFIRPDGKTETFVKSGTQWTSDLDVTDSLSEIRDAQSVLQGYKLFIAEKNRFEIYSLSGKLLRVEDRNGVGINLSYSDSQTNPAIAPQPGLLLSVVNSQGRGLNFVYDAASRLSQLITPDGGVITYSYDLANDLTQVQYADGKTQQYLYNEPAATGGANLPHYLTAIVDENNNRYKEVFYDSQGRATVSRRTGGVGSVNVTYNANGSATLLYASGVSTTLTPLSQLNRSKIASLSQPCSPACEDPWMARAYDSYGFPLWYKDFLGVNTKTVHNSQGLVEQKIEAYNTTNQRTINTSWDINLRKPLLRSFVNSQNQTIKKQQWVYNTRGQTIANCDINPTLAPSYNCSITGTPPTGVRRWTYAYCDAINSQCPLLGLLLTADGPRTDVSDVTTYTYYTSASNTAGNVHALGDLATVTNALSQATSITNYDLNGRPLSITDPNGIVTTLTYAPRGWLKTKTINGVQTTTYDYDNIGQLTKVTLPDNSYLSYTYDTAHRLTDIADSAGNKTHYTLDAMGNRTQEDTKDPSNNILKTRSRVFDALSRLQKDIGGTSPTTQITQYTYDNNGNLKTITDPLNHVTTNGYDTLNRLITVTDPANNTATTAYNVLDQVTSVTDPRSLVTQYTNNALGDVTQTQSPDTGTTQNVYDAAGNITQKTDARNIVATYTYDALNRVTSVTYPAHTSENVSFTYDSTANGNYGRGKLTGYSNDGGATVLTYDAYGNLKQQTEQIGSQYYVTAYQYDSANRLQQIAYPSGRIVTYTRSTLGQISQVQTQDTTGGAITTLASSIAYKPLGPTSSITFGNGVTTTLQYDTDYRVSRITATSTPNWDFVYGYDAASNITALTDQVSTYSKSYGYDNLDRLTSDNNNVGQYGYQYNANGRRTQRAITIGGNTTTQTPTYSATSNKLIQLDGTATTVDAADNLTALGTKGFAYNNANRLSSAMSSGATIAQMTYDALGRRTQKISALTTHYRYAPDGKILTTKTYNGSGTPTEEIEYIWLNDMPVAQVQSVYTSGSVSNRRTTYIHADHLNTPRALTDSTKKIVWRWDGDAYGNTSPNTNPDGDSTVDNLTLRFPGQLADSETGLNYNLFRDYNPNTGDYSLQADPLGLQGGSWSLQGYVKGNPVSLTDPTGLYVYYPPDPSINSVICNGSGGLIPQIPSWGEPYDLCIGDCMREHEIVHIVDLRRIGKSACVGRLRGEVITFDTAEQVNSSELRAYETEIACLRKKLREKTECDDKCKQVINDRINQLNEAKKKY